MEIIQWINVSVSSNVYPEPSPVSVLFFNWISDGGDGKDIEDITWPRGEKKFIVECWNIFLHKKINFVSTRSHVIFFLLYKMWRFSEDFRPLSSEGQTNVSQHFRRFSEDCRRRPKEIRGCFDHTPINLSVVKRDKDHFFKNDIFLCEDIISSHVRICRLYRFVTTRYTTDFYIINCIIFYYSFDQTELRMVLVVSVHTISV